MCQLEKRLAIAQRDDALAQVQHLMTDLETSATTITTLRTDLSTCQREKNHWKTIAEREENRVAGLNQYVITLKEERKEENVALNKVEGGGGWRAGIRYHHNRDRDRDAPDMTSFMTCMI